MKILEAAARLLSLYIRKHRIDGFNEHIEFDYQVKRTFLCPFTNFLLSIKRILLIMIVY